MGDGTGISWTDATLRPCAHCEIAKPPEAFAVDRSRPDGRTRWCRDCRNERSRTRHVSRATGAPRGPAPLDERDGDRRQARRTVNHLGHLDDRTHDDAPNGPTP